MSTRPPAAESKQRLRGAAGFEAYYGEIFGERWPRLRAALVGGEHPGGSRPVRANGFASGLEELARELDDAARLPVPGCYLLPALAAWSERDESGLIKGYAMDPASVVAAHALPVAGARDVLDLCAAPGGKSLILAERAASDARLVFNDRSPERRKRLKKVLADHVPPAMLARITVTGHDGRNFGVHRPGAFDAILLDAPCSSEAHVLADQAALASWSSTRSERLSRDQYGLLTAALLALRPGGWVLYATCALSPDENDGVVRRLLERGRHPAEIERVDAGIGEATELGWQILPDETGFGPMYFCLLRRPAG